MAVCCGNTAVMKVTAGRNIARYPEMELLDTGARQYENENRWCRQMNDS